VFLISGGLRYEMAPKTWSGAGTPDAVATWCDGLTDVPTANGLVIGTGTTNTAAMAASVACSSNAAVAVGLYAPAGTSAGQWFLPSKDELNAMWLYSQVPGFNTATYGWVASDFYWSSSQLAANFAWFQNFDDGYQNLNTKTSPRRVRPVRAF
jgi:hypothetical protein